MRIGRTLPPAAAPLSFSNIFSGIKAGFCGDVAVERFREELKDYFQVQHCFLVSSGKAALSLILTALKELHPERDEVLIPALNCFSVPSAISRAGLKVALCDIDRDTLDFDYEQLAAKLDNPNLLCVIPTHLFGRPADLCRLKSIVTDPFITIIEDAAQSFGGEASGQKLGTICDVSLLSLGRGKALSTVEGGIVMTDRIDLATHIEKIHKQIPASSLLGNLRLILYSLALSCLQHPLLYWLPNSLPFLNLGQTVYDPTFELQKFSPLQAGFAKGWQRKIEKLKEIRKAHAEDWAMILDEFKQTHYGRVHGETADLIRFPWRIESQNRRSQILKESQQFGLGIAETYPTSIDLIPKLKNNFQSEAYPAAEECARTLVTLPVHPFINLRDKEKIKQSIQNCINGLSV